MIVRPCSRASLVDLCGATGFLKRTVRKDALAPLSVDNLSAFQMFFDIHVGPLSYWDLFHARFLLSLAARFQPRRHVTTGTGGNSFGAHDTNYDIARRRYGPQVCRQQLRQRSLHCFALHIDPFLRCGRVSAPKMSGFVLSQ